MEIAKNCVKTAKFQYLQSFGIKLYFFLFQVAFTVRHTLLHNKVCTVAEHGTMEVTKDPGLSGVT